MFGTVQKSWDLLSRRQKIALSLLSLARAFSNALDILGITLIGLVGALAFNPSAPIPFISSAWEKPDNLLVIFLGAAGMVFVLKTVVGISLFRITALFLAKIETHYSVEVSRAIFAGFQSEFRSLSQPQTEWMILRSTNTAFSKVLGSAVTFVAEATLAIFVFIFLFVTDWGLAVAVTLYFAAILFFFQIFSQNIVQRSGQDMAQGSTEVHQSITSLTQAYKEITVLSKTAYFLETLAVARSRVARAEATDNYLSAIPRLVVEMGLILGAVGFAVALIIFGEGPSSIVLFGIFLMASLRIMSALLPLQRAFQALRYYKSQAQSSQDFLAGIRKARAEAAGSPLSDNASVARDSGTIPPSKGAGIRAKGVNFHYPDSIHRERVLTDISLDIVGGSTVAIIGPSGAGKSTLVDVFLGLLTPTDGLIECDGISPEHFRQTYSGVTAYVPQKPGLVFGSIEENIAIGVAPEEIDQDALWEALRTSSLAEFVESLPNGPRSSLGAHMDSLSGGQIQRLGLARALYTKPRLMVLDEATSALDAETEAAITESLALLKGHTTLIVVAHRLSTVQTADVVHVLDAGKIVASGTFQSLKKSDPLVKRYVELMSLQG